MYSHLLPCLFVFQIELCFKLRLQRFVASGNGSGRENMHNQRQHMGGVGEGRQGHVTPPPPPISARPVAGSLLGRSPSTCLGLALGPVGDLTRAMGWLMHRSPLLGGVCGGGVLETTAGRNPPGLQGLTAWPLLPRSRAWISC